MRWPTLGLVLGLVWIATSTSHAAIGYMFWADQGNVYRARMDGNDKTVIHSEGDGYVGWVDVDPRARKVYLRGETIGSNAGVIRRMNYDGSEAEKVLTGLNFGGYGLGLDLDNHRMYFGDHSIGAFAADFNGSNKSLLPNTSSGFDRLRHTHDFEVVGDKLYYSNDEHPAWAIGGIERFTGIRRTDLDGTNIETIVGSEQGSTGFSCLAVDQATNTLYWSEDKSDSVYRLDLEQSDAVAERFLTGIPAYDLEIDRESRTLYFTTSWNSTYLGRINLDGTGLEHLVTLSDTDGAKGLALAPGATIPAPSSFTCMAGLFGMAFVAAWYRRRRGT